MKTTYRKLVPSLAIAGIAALSLTACGGDKKEAPAPEKSSSAAASSSAPADDQSSEAPAPDDQSSSAPAPDDQSSSAAGGSDQAASGDQAACKSAFDAAQKGSQELSSSMSDPETGAAAVQKLANEIKSNSANIKSPEHKNAVESYAKYFSDIADAMKAKDMNKLQALAKQGSDTNSDLYKASMALGKCVAGM